MAIVTVGIDLANNIFDLHGIDEAGKPVLVKPKVRREQLLEVVAALPPCLIGMAACSGAHHWARQFSRVGHTVKLIAPKFVAPYRLGRKRGKNDAADAAAICEAVTRPHMRFVPVRDVDQQAMLCLHRTRQGFIEERTALYNRLRGLIAEFGIVLPQKVGRLRQEVGPHLEDLPGWANRCVGDLLTHADRLDERIDEYDRIIAEAARQDARSRRLMGLRGIGTTTASALLAGLGDKQDRFSRWARSLVERRGYWKAAIAIAAKNLRLAWAVLKYGEDFRLAAEAVGAAEKSVCRSRSAKESVGRQPVRAGRALTRLLARGWAAGKKRLSLGRASKGTGQGMEERNPTIWPSEPAMT